MAKKNVLTQSRKKAADALLQENRLVEARELYAKICRIDTADAQAWFRLGVISSQLGDFVETENCCRRVLAVEPHLSDAGFLMASALEAQGKLDEAEARYRQALRLKPASAEGHARLGMVLQRTGKLESAQANYRESLRLDPRQPLIHYNLGVVLNELKCPLEAEQSYREALWLDPDNAKVHANLAFVLRVQGKLEEAEASYREALRIDPDCAEIYYNLGLTLKDQGRYDEAALNHRSALERSPQYVDAYVGLAHALQGSKNHSEALVNFEKALEIRPDLDDPEVYMGRAYALQVLGKYSEALADYAHVIELKPEYAAAHHNQGLMLFALGIMGEAIGRFQQALRLVPDYVEAFIGLGSAWLALNRSEEALACFEQALQIAPENANAQLFAAVMAEKTGDIEKACQYLSPLIETHSQKFDVMIMQALLGKSLGTEEHSIARIEDLLQKDPSLSVEQIRKAHFLLGKLYDARKQFDAAFAHYRQGNESKSANFDHERYRLDVDSIIAVQNADFLASMPRASIRSERPVFIVGMPRSGTSLVEQILDSHPDIHGAGELTTVSYLATSLPRRLKTEATYPYCLTTLGQETADALASQYLELLTELSPDARRVTDKLPGNFMFLGFIEQIFPGARVIHCRRDPMDTCLSCYFLDFTMPMPYSYKLNDLGVYYRGYERLMAHWRQVINLPLYEVQYENLIDNPEKISRELVAFCGLEWDERCLRFHESKRVVATASYDQVRQPIYKKSVARWKHYERHLGPLKEALGL